MKNIKKFSKNKMYPAFIVIFFAMFTFTFIESVYFSSAQEENSPMKIALGNAPSISFNGEKIAYISPKNGQPELFVMDKLGREKILTNDIFFESEPSFIPSVSDNEIVYVSDVSGNRELWLINVEAGEKKQLTKSEGLKYSPSANRYGEIAYVSGFYPKFDLYVLRNGNEERITFDKTEKFSPVWSPDGDKIAFIEREGKQYSIFVIDRKGNREKVAGNVYYRGLAWSRKDNSILFVRRSSEGYDIWKSEPEAKKETLIYKGITDSWEIEPAFGENKILFSSDKDGAYHIYEIVLEEMKPVQVDIPIPAPVLVISPEPLPSPELSSEPQTEEDKDKINIEISNENYNKEEINTYDSIVNHNDNFANDYSELPVPKQTNEKQKDGFELEILLALLLSSISLAAIRKVKAQKFSMKDIAV